MDVHTPMLSIVDAVPAIFVIAFLLIFLVLIPIAIYQNAKQRRAFQELAARLGMTYTLRDRNLPRISIH